MVIDRLMVRFFRLVLLSLFVSSLMSSAITRRLEEARFHVATLCSMLARRLPPRLLRIGSSLSSDMDSLLRDTDFFMEALRTSMLLLLLLQLVCSRVGLRPALRVGAGCWSSSSSSLLSSTRSIREDLFRCRAFSKTEFWSRSWDLISSTCNRRTERRFCSSLERVGLPAPSSPKLLMRRRARRDLPSSSGSSGLTPKLMLLLLRIRTLGCRAKEALRLMMGAACLCSSASE